jgi:hypothetical protein
VLLDNKYGGIGGEIDAALSSLIASSEYKTLCESYGVEYDSHGIMHPRTLASRPMRGSLE